MPKLDYLFLYTLCTPGIRHSFGILLSKMPSYYIGHCNRQEYNLFRSQTLRQEMDEGEPTYEATVQLNKQLVTDKVLEGRKATNSEKDLQSFATRFAALGKRSHDKTSALYTILLNLAQTTMDEVNDDITDANTKVDQTTMAERFPQVKQDFHNAKVFKNLMGSVCFLYLQNWGLLYERWIALSTG